MVKKIGAALVAVGAVAAMSSGAEAAVMTINDGVDSYSLNVQTGCTTCSVVLTISYGAGSTRTGAYLDEIQWDLTTPNVNPTNVTAAGFLASTTAGNASSWSFAPGNANGSNCGGGDPNAVCGTYADPGVLVTAPGSFVFNFSAQFSSMLTAVSAGNIRASYNDANGRKTGSIFSPGGGQFTTTTTPTTTGTPTTGNVPEPAALSLFGAALAGLAYRLRRGRS